MRAPSVAELVGETARVVLDRIVADEEHARRVASLNSMRDARYVDLVTAGLSATEVSALVTEALLKLQPSVSLRSAGVSHDTVLRAVNAAR